MTTDRFNDGYAAAEAHWKRRWWQANGELQQALSAIERVRELHQPIPVYEHYDYCGHHEGDCEVIESEVGELLCGKSPLGYSMCNTCRDDDGDPIDHPCPTTEALEDK